MNKIFLSLLLALSLHLGAGSAHAVEAGAPVPALSLPKLEGGGEVSMAQFKGQVLYVDFWASWCAPCRLAFPSIEGLYKRNRERGFAVVGINKDTKAGDADRFLRSVPVTFPLVADDQDAAAKAFAVKTMPSGYVIDRKGVVRHVHRGYTAETSKQLAEQVEALLKEAP